MAKFFNILAASVGSGLVLGASIRLGEALGSKLKAALPEPAQNGSQSLRPSASSLFSRLDSLEDKMSWTFSRFDQPSSVTAAPTPEWESIVAGVVTRMDRQQSDVDSIRQQVSKATRMLDSVGDITKHLRSDLQKELSRNLDERLTAAEGRVHLKMEAARGETLDAMVSAMENRVTPRIIRMESDIACQTAAVSELRECALQSEQSIQRLLGVLERITSPAQANSGPSRHSGTPQNGPKHPSGNYKSQVATIS
jgi:Skp family chaperone for outer membrane proteins